MKPLIIILGVFLVSCDTRHEIDVTLETAPPIICDGGGGGGVAAIDWAALEQLVEEGDGASDGGMKSVDASRDGRNDAE